MHKLCLLFSVITALVSHYHNFIQRQRLDLHTDTMSSISIILTTKDPEVPQSTQDKPPTASSTRQTSRKGKAPEVARCPAPRCLVHHTRCNMHSLSRTTGLNTRLTAAERTDLAFNNMAVLPKIEPKTSSMIRSILD